jgi:hypothetical protein
LTRGSKLRSLYLARGDILVHGTTHAINAIVTGSTARTAFLTTKGHPDTLVWREGGRAEAFDFKTPYPEPYIPKALTFEIPERIVVDGSVKTPLDEAATVAVRYRRRGGRKMVIGEVSPTSTPRPRNNHVGPHRTILKALGRAYRWKRMLESAEFTSITDLAAAEKINHSYVRRMLRLTLLSPEITEQILDGHLSKTLQLEGLLKPFPDEWTAQCF